jgi:ornithine--oxo-acid transaminase
VVGTEEVMSLVGVAEMASTFGNTPVGVAATNATLDLIDEPGYMERGPVLGKWFQDTADSWNYEFITEAVACGADMCLYIDENNPAYPVTGRKIGALCVQKGLLVVVSPRNRIRMSPPLIITDAEMAKAMEILKEALDEVMDYDEVPGEFWTGPE